MIKKLTLEWLYAAAVRAIKTVAQTALGMFTIGVAMNEIQWQYVLSVSAVSGVFSMLTSIATSLPEISSDGVIQIDTSDVTGDAYLLALNNDADTLKTKKYVRLKVDPKANLQ